MGKKSWHLKMIDVLPLAGDCLWYLFHCWTCDFWYTLFLLRFQIIIEDLRENFINDYVWPSIRGGLIYEDRYLLGTSLARPCIASGLVRAAIRENANFISHGATGKGNDQVRFELACYSLHPTVQALWLSLSSSIPHVIMLTWSLYFPLKIMTTGFVGFPDYRTLAPPKIFLTICRSPGSFWICCCQQYFTTSYSEKSMELRCKLNAYQVFFETKKKNWKITLTYFY